MQTIYNTLTRKKEVLVPIEPGKVKMYVCGPTVYDYFHIGNARTFTVFDMVFRWLKASGHEVNYARNITDIDDKIIERANANGEPIDALTERMTAAMHEDFDRLKLERPTHEPRATRYIDGMLDIIRMLEDKGIAYRAPNGDVYFAVRKFEGYGRLSRRNLDDPRAGEEVTAGANKRDPHDFALWKAAKPHEPRWPSIFGDGRPGWHIECSAMCKAVLGERLDIHGGGWDLQFPHHENEIAQSEGALGHPFVNVWMHAAFLNFDNEKMSKSLGNFSTARDVLDRLNPVRGGEEVRFFLLRGHYRSEISYTYDALVDAANSLMGLYRVLKDVPPDDAAVDWCDPFAARFRTALEDDFDTPAAYAVLYELRDEVRRTGSRKLSGLLRDLGGAIGLLQENPGAYVQGELPPVPGFWSVEEGSEDDAEDSASFSSEPVSPSVEELVLARKAAKVARDFARADIIRKQLDSMGIVLEDKPGGVTEWRRK